MESEGEHRILPKVVSVDINDTAIDIHFETGKGFDCTQNKILEMCERVGLKNPIVTRICDGCKVELDIDYIEGIHECDTCHLK